MTYIPTTPPTAEPLTPAEAKAHLRLDTPDEDTLVTSLIIVAREHIERVTGLCLMTQAWRLAVDSMSEDGVIQIVKGPVQTIEKLTVYDHDGEPSEIPLDGSVLDGRRRPARLVLAQAIRPGRAANGIEIDFTAGFGPAATDVPDTLKRAMLVHIAQMFTCRGVVTLEEQPAMVPVGYDRLIAPFMLRSL